MKEMLTVLHDSEREVRCSTVSEHIRGNGKQNRAMVMHAEAMLRPGAEKRDEERLEWLLHEDFTGVTREGENFSREDAVGATRQTTPCVKEDFTLWDFHTLPWPLVLARYTFADDQGDSQHVSIWDVSTGLARLRFHQGRWAADALPAA